MNYNLLEKFGVDPQKGNQEKRDQGEEIVRLTNVHKTYLIGAEGVTALRGVSLSIYRGEFVMIQGTSGGGKTTMLNMIGTIDKPTKGDVAICGKRIKNSTEDSVLAQIRLDSIGFVFQAFNLLSSLTALENVELPMMLRGTLSREASRKRAIELLEKVGLGKRLTHFPNQLSGGEQQRVTIARALSNNPGILLLDEPTGDLDTKNSDLVMELLIDLNKNEGITMVMVTHDVMLRQYASKLVRVLDGKINSVEEQDSEARESACRLLKSNNEKEYRSGENTGSNNLGLRLTSGVGNVLSHSKTETRRPSDYECLRNQKRPSSSSTQSTVPLSMASSSSGFHLGQDLQESRIVKNEREDE